MFLSESIEELKFETVKDTFIEFCNSVNDYLDELESRELTEGMFIIKTENIQQIADILAFILGICMGKLDLCEFIGKQLGNFENEEVKFFSKILIRNKKKIFGGLVTGLPKITYVGDLIPSTEEIHKFSKKAATEALEIGTEYAVKRGKSLLLI